MTMIERVARAICSRLGHDPDFVPAINPLIKKGQVAVDDCARPYWTNFSGEARAAIAAMREPTEWMLNRGADPFIIGLNGHDFQSDASAVWQAMIDSILQEVR